ncbi:MAG: YidC/Oxa1 family membrane protein insertase [Acidimicrobiia bacterium]|nr:YidC/Oxa1 family membrane protein insertase [Acidimicrobiia bacterium]
MFETLIDASLGSVARLLGVFYELPVVGGSFGVAIILLTLTVMIVLMPLTLKATKSTIKMTQLQPKLRELQKKYKDDKQQLNAEMMALYQSEGVNPVGGCLPMLAQLPVFLVLFNVLRGLARRVSDKPFYSVANHAREITGRATEIDPRSFDPQYLSQDSQMYVDLTDGRTSMDFGPFDLADSAWDVVQADFVTSLPYLVLIVFVVGTSYYQQKQISARRNPNETLTPQQQTQQQLLKILPLMSGAWSFVFPAGLVLYWATSNLFRIGQQSYITRSLYTGDAPGAQMLKEQAERKKSDEDDEVDDESDRAASSAEGRGGKSGSGKAGSGKSGSGKGGGKGGGSANGADASSAAAGGSSDAMALQNGDGSGGSTVTDREKRWAERRAQKAKIQARRSAASGSGSSGSSAASSRVTPKGTKPASSKRSRRKR